MFSGIQRKKTPRVEERSVYQEIGGAAINPKFHMKIVCNISLNNSQLKVEMDTSHTWYISNQKPQKKNTHHKTNQTKTTKQPKQKPPKPPPKQEIHLSPFLKALLLLSQGLPWS